MKDVFENLALTRHTEGNADKGKQRMNYLASLAGQISRYTKKSKNYKGEKIVKNHHHLRPEGTRQRSSIHLV